MALCLVARLIQVKMGVEPFFIAQHTILYIVNSRGYTIARCCAGTALEGSERMYPTYHEDRGTQQYEVIPDIALARSSAWLAKWG